MKNRKILILATILAACTFVNSASAQNRLKMELGYNISTPLGSFKNDFIKNTSYRGATGEISYTFNPKFTLGLSSGYQSYYQKYDRQTYKLSDNQVVSAVVTNTMDITPFILRGTFYPMGASETAKVQPYVSAGAGINMVSYGQYLGEFGGTETSTPFAAQAGAGIRIPVSKGASQTGIKIGATYNYVNYNHNEIKNLNNIGVNAGVVFSLK